MVRKDDLIGKKQANGELAVQKYIDSRNGERYLLCLCSCGNTTEVRLSHFCSENIKTCGCSRYFSLQELNDILKSHGGVGKINWSSKGLCELECCGKKEITAVSNITFARHISCGCLSSRHGHCSNENERITLEYRAWRKMIERCTDEKATGYENYGGRGITICDKWLGKFGFKNFIQDLGNKPDDGYSLDRIDFNGNYEPSNCRWATKRQQNQNTSQCRYVYYNNEKYSLTELCRELNISLCAVRHRLERGKSFEEAISKPIPQFKEREERKRDYRYKANFSAYKKRRGFTDIKDDLTYELWVKKQEEYNYCCAYCKRSVDEIIASNHKWTRDHLIARSKGGFDTYNNVVPACNICNCSKGVSDFPKMGESYKNAIAKAKEKLELLKSHNDDVEASSDLDNNFSETTEN